MRVRIALHAALVVPLLIVLSACGQRGQLAPITPIPAYSALPIGTPIVFPDALYVQRFGSIEDAEVECARSARHPLAQSEWTACGNGRPVVIQGTAYWQISNPIGTETSSIRLRARNPDPDATPAIVVSPSRMMRAEDMPSFHNATTQEPFVAFFKEASDVTPSNRQNARWKRSYTQVDSVRFYDKAEPVTPPKYLLRDSSPEAAAEQP